jgi:DNA (cytosine-5)-methyltransferase 1
MTAYYNEYDAKAAAWLRELIKAGLIAPGEVDERSIIDVKPSDIRGFTQCHFFAGIGGWSYALRLAGWADDRPVWTGSPPCQPFSNAGKQKAQADARHLWPVFFNFIRECKPANIFGEQVEAAIRTGWLDDLQDDLEAENYATGKIVLPACSVGGYHIRQRIWFVAERVADTKGRGDSGIGRDKTSQNGENKRIGENTTRLSRHSDGCSSIIGLAESDSARWEPWQRHNQAAGHGNTVATEGSNGGVDDSESFRPRFRDPKDIGPANAQINVFANAGDCESDKPSREQPSTASADAPNSIWRNPDWLFCRDGKWRPVESGTFPLAHGVSERVGLLRGYGNAIVPQVAAEVIKAYMEAGGHDL